MLGPQETMPLALIWAEQLDRFKISPKLYDEILNRCIDFRRKALLDGKDFIPALSVELFLAMFERYRDERLFSIRNDQSRIRTLNEQIEWYTRERIRPDGTFSTPEEPEYLDASRQELADLMAKVAEHKRASFLFTDE